jgi:hypothetical protein
MQQGVLRTWCCQNMKCGTTFDAWENYPACPQCGCVRCNWIPGGGHIGKSAPRIDATFRDLAQAYGMTDIASARAGERAMPKLPQGAHETGPQMQFAPGFVGTAYRRDAAGDYRSVCSFSPHASVKVKTAVGSKLRGATNAPPMTSNTRVEGSCKG